MVVRGRTRNAIGPQGRVGSTPTISVRKQSSGIRSPGTVSLYREVPGVKLFYCFAVLGRLTCPWESFTMNEIIRAGGRDKWH